MVEFKDRLIEALEKRNMKASELAKLSGINEGAISQYKKGAYKPAQYNLDKMAKALNVSVAWLMGCTVQDPDSSTNSITTEILEAYNKLSPAAQQRARDYLEDLLSNPRNLRDNRKEV